MHGLANGGMMNLHQTCAFSAVAIEGTALSTGTHPYSELAASFPNNFAAGGSGSITVRAAAPVFGPMVRSGNTLTLSWTGGGRLQEASEVTGAWTDVAGNPQGSYSVQTTGTRRFYRLIP